MLGYLTDLRLQNEDTEVSCSLSGMAFKLYASLGVGWERVPITVHSKRSNFNTSLCFLFITWKIVE